MFIAALSSFPWQTWVLFYGSGNYPPSSPLDLRLSRAQMLDHSVSKWFLSAHPLPPHISHPGSSWQLSRSTFCLDLYIYRERDTHSNTHTDTHTWFYLESQVIHLGWFTYFQRLLPVTDPLILTQLPWVPHIPKLTIALIPAKNAHSHLISL